MNCSIAGCDRPTYSRGWCCTHYGRWSRHGDPKVVVRPRGLSLEDRFWSKVNRRGPDECWPWTAGRNDGGYGAFAIGNRMVRAHRVAYELLVGPIPDGLQIDHVRDRGCLFRHCVNPAHLQPVTHAVNVGRGDAGQHHAVKTECVNGHEFTPENTIIRKNGCRDCRKCGNQRMREYRARLKAG